MCRLHWGGATFFICLWQSPSNPLLTHNARMLEIWWRVSSHPRRKKRKWKRERDNVDVNRNLLCKAVRRRTFFVGIMKGIFLRFAFCCFNFAKNNNMKAFNTFSFQHSTDGSGFRRNSNIREIISILRILDCCLRNINLITTDRHHRSLRCFLVPFYFAFSEIPFHSKMLQQMMSMQLAWACGWSCCTLYKHLLCNSNFADAQTMCFCGERIFDNIPALQASTLTANDVEAQRWDYRNLIAEPSSCEQLLYCLFRKFLDSTSKLWQWPEREARAPPPTDTIKMLFRARKFPNLGGSKHEQTRNLLPFTMSICAVKIPLHPPFSASLSSDPPHVCYWKAEIKKSLLLKCLNGWSKVAPFIDSQLWDVALASDIKKWVKRAWTCKEIVWGWQDC